MQLTDFQYLLPKRRYVILCKQVCFVPISPIFSCRVTFALWGLIVSLGKTKGMAVGVGIDADIMLSRFC